MQRGKNSKTKNRLRRLRKLRNYNHNQVMEILGMRSNNRLSQWESGVRFPNLKNAFKLSILYNTLIDQLFFELREQALNEIEVSLNQIPTNKIIAKRKKPP
jgi:transcriptional regulator with XRE-family HTH domain